MEGWSQSVYSELQRDVDTQIHSAKSLCSICQVWDLLLFEKSHSHQCGKRSSNARPYCIRFEGKKRCEIGNPCNCQFTCLLQLHAPVADCIIASLNSDILCSLSLSLLSGLHLTASDCINFICKHLEQAIFWCIQDLAWAFSKVPRHSSLELCVGKTNRKTSKDKTVEEAEAKRRVHFAKLSAKLQKEAPAIAAPGVPRTAVAPDGHGKVHMKSWKMKRRMTCGQCKATLGSPV